MLMVWIWSSKQNKKKWRKKTLKVFFRGEVIIVVEELKTVMKEQVKYELNTQPLKMKHVKS